MSPQLDSKSVKHTALCFLSLVLRRALATVDHCLSGEAWLEAGVYTAPMMEDFVRLFREALSKVGTAASLGLPAEVSGAFRNASQKGHRGRGRGAVKGSVGWSWGPSPIGRSWPAPPLPHAAPRLVGRAAGKPLGLLPPQIVLVSQEGRSSAH